MPVKLQSMIYDLLFSFPLCTITSISWYLKFCQLNFVGHFTRTRTRNYKKIKKEIMHFKVF